MTWYRYKMIIEDNWLNWNNLKFLKHPDWSNFIKQKKIGNNYLNIENDLKSQIKIIDEISIIHLTNRYQLRFFNYNNT